MAIVAGHWGARTVLGGEGEQWARGVRLIEWAGALAGAGHQVDIYLRRDATEVTPPPLPEGVRLIAVPVGPAAPIDESAVLGLLAAFGHWLGDRWSEGEPPQVVHALSWQGGLSAVAAAREIGAPVVQSFDALGAGRRPAGGDAATLRQRARCEQALARSVDQVVAQSQDEIEQLSRLGVPRTRISLVPLGVDVERFLPRGPLAPRPADRPRLLVVGRPSADSGHDDLLRALRGVVGVEAVAIGADPDGWWAARGADAAAAGLDWHGYVGPLEMPRWLRSADLVVCPARYEPMGTVAVEAMACGIPVVASAVGALAEAVVDRLTGDLVPPADPVRLGLGIRRLIQDDVRRLAYATAALDRARHCYTWERCAAQLTGVYQTAIASVAAPVSV